MSFVSSLVATILAATLSGALDVSVVQKVATALAQGTNPYSIDGVHQPEKPIASETNLRGCDPQVSSGSSRDFILIDYICTSGEQRFAHRVSFNGSDGGEVQFWIDPLASGIGPTAEAISASELPSKRRQFWRFMKAARSDGDPTLGGIIPITEGQHALLRRISGCQWDGDGQNKGVEYFVFVSCRGGGTDGQRMITIHFDEHSRAEMVRMEIGKRVARPL